MYLTLKKRLLHVSNRQAVHPQEALFTVYEDSGTCRACRGRFSELNT